MKSSYFYLFALLIALLTSCSPEDIPTNAQYRPKFVVEGSISLGGFPKVALTHNLPVAVPIDSTQLEEIIIRWAKVEVFSEDEHEVLTLVKKEDGFPFYHYVGRRLRGREGQTYHLRISYDSNTMEASTTIPVKPTIDELTFNSIDDSTRLVQLSFTDREAMGDFYRFYGKSKGDAHFASFTPGGMTDAQANGQSVTFQLYRNRASNIAPDTEMYYKVGDTVQVRLVSMPEDAFSFWKHIDALTAQLPSLEARTPIQGNIDGPALGIWHGEAYDEKTIIAH